MLALASAQVGDHSSIAQLETLDQIDKLDDPLLLYSVTKIFSSVVAMFASALAERAGVAAGTAEHDSKALEAIQTAGSILAASVLGPISTAWSKQKWSSYRGSDDDET